MKQHPIPQNILDVEFKLFTRFTLREFAYVAIGIGFGGIFLYLFTKGTLPGIIAIPIFVISSAIGLFLGLVPINDQGADIFMKNFLAAIRKPTQRVWRNRDFDEKVNTIAEARGLNITRGGMQRGKGTDKKGAEIIGASTLQQTQQFAAPQTLKELEDEENRNLNEITQALQQLSMAQPQSQPTAKSQFQIKQPVPATQQPVAQQTIPLQPTTQIAQQPIVQQTIPPQPTITTNYPAPQVIMNQPSTVQTSINPAMQNIPQLLITSQNIKNYEFPMPNYQPQINRIAIVPIEITGNIAMGAVVTIKDPAGTAIEIKKAMDNGIFLSDFSLPAGEYIVSVQHPQYRFPNVRFVLSDFGMPIIKISAL